MEHGEAESPTNAAARLLLVDDTPTNLQVLFQTLDGRGYELLVARTGEDALTIAAEARPDLILLDIMMPGIDGFETCRRLKDDASTCDAAIIFMSALDDTKDKVRGLDLGAVDYITKPFQAEEVIARVDTHLTVQRLQRSLAARNAELDAANRLMKRDLEAAAQVQQALLPAAAPATPTARFAWAYRPCDELAGDSLNVFEIDEGRIGLYVLDVCGHGVPAALLSVAVTHVLCQRRGSTSIITEPGASGGEGGAVVVVPPARVAERLNDLFPMSANANRYFTLVYGVLDAASGRFRFTTAGHPGPVLVRQDGAVEALGSPSFPVGIVEGATYDDTVVDLTVGDRLYLYSDALIEERDHAGELFGPERVERCLAGQRGRPIEDALTAIIDAVAGWRGSDRFSDDLSLVVAEIVAGSLGQLGVRSGQLGVRS